MKTVYRGFCDRNPLSLINLEIKSSKNYSFGKGVYFAYEKEFAHFFQFRKNHFGIIGEYKIAIPDNALILGFDFDLNLHTSNSESHDKIHKLYTEDSVKYYNQLKESYEEFKAIDQPGREVCLKTLDYPVELVNFTIIFVDYLAAELIDFIKDGEMTSIDTVERIAPESLPKVIEFLKNKELL